MKLTIFGANGKTGTRLAVPPHSDLLVGTADVMGLVAIAPAVAGADIVVSAVGPRGRAATTILRDSTGSIIAPMKKSGANRLVTVSGSMVDDTADGFFLRHVAKPMTRRIFKGPCADMRQAEDQIHASTLDWTILRPPRLTDKGGTRRYRTAIDRNLAHGSTLSRTDLVTSILTLSDDPKSIGKQLFMAN